MDNPAEVNVFEEFLRRYYHAPTLFVQEVLGAQPYDYQSELLDAVARGDRKISVRSGHGTGKSTTASWCMLWFLLTRFPSKTVVTAPTTGQLFDALFSELKRWINELPAELRELLEVKSDRVELNAAKAEAFISARTSRAETPEALAGVHSENVLLVVDEASGVPEPVFEAASGSMSGHTATTLLMSNPTRSSGTFFESHHGNSEAWTNFHWSCVLSPLVSDDFVEEMKERYGEDSNAFRVRVLGEFPLADDDTVIPYHLVESAMGRRIDRDETAKPVWSLDVARFGNDDTVLLKRAGGVVYEVAKWSGKDLMHTVGRIKADYDGLPTPLQPRVVLVDVIGMGGGVVDRLRELNVPVRGVNVSEAPAAKDNYVNLRSELWFKVKGWLEQKTVSLIEDKRLLTELTSVRYRFTSQGKMQVESKDEMKRRGLKSPDVADALVLSMAEEAIVMMGGGSLDWDIPITRGLKGVA